MHTPFDRPGPRSVEPGEYPALDEALALVNRDVAATLPEERPLRLMAMPPWEDDEPEHVYVTRANGEWWGNPIWQAEDGSWGRDPLGAVAEAAQDTVSERLWQAWPVCTLHNLGMHLSSTDDGRPAWLCAGKAPDAEHVRAAVGELDGI
ncbi:hypothetical protein ABZ848_27090 [Streptomyces sp. NPDC047081]|uniref:hypothetical protein n=1 Tax=Streptomyces sp. NPDC047081 TaxID=3154706 RepID=UPI0033C44DF9